MSDQLQKFMFNAAPVRGEIVSLRNTWQEVLTRRDYPTPVRNVLGEMMAACALLSANLKFDGTLIMQIFGDGPVKMLVVQCSADLAMRATAKFSGDAAQIIGDGTSFANLINASGHGRCVITLDPADKRPGQQPYQGIVPLNGEDGPLASIADVLEHYMRHSEQLDTRLWLAADQDRAVGVLLQKLPGDGGIVPRVEETDTDTWERVCTLGGTLSSKELLEVEPETVFRRLFWQENVQHFEPTATRFQCTCSREKVGGMLRMLGRVEIDGVIEERGHVEIHCEFCNQRYEFDPVDVVQLFATPELGAGVAPAAAQRH
ncbi:Hsp33 family molecular chaperone HslO [Burkholderia thailandensis]|uniref:Hsp33 family protein n=2 Tax=Burkholderia thailandensis TaxID=57975 RepID=A0AAW9D692_BURTH|nr:Hsp33 family molecular chaperone HslO [Burkholderia thailandensis]ABC37947.1 33 kDa. chaperonin [Burkholderia thailandensis E264]AHI66174.1 hsp33 family protein [Burkholderia thailandensis H0587]AHI72224.1 hsp33 family protein [Burkholderia thailandensis 2002721723]AHI80361.1 hsp33 family protein [Burkholderia thailandensis E444]AIC87374.1 hsp33 family protein [Burkholderia thailandensis USAMRU Malaysia \